MTIYGEIVAATESQTEIGKCKICGAPIYSPTTTDFPVPTWSCGHFAQQVTVQVNGGS